MTVVWLRFHSLVGAVAMVLSSLLGALDEAAYRDLDVLYRQLHSRPELSNVEVHTARVLTRRFRQLGFMVTSGVGGTGVVAVLVNGEGPTLMLRADMDGLPVREKTGLRYASRVRMVSQQGVEQPVMHACGHDVHMTVLVGTLRELSARRTEWAGTLVAIAQPAEEVGQGARQMLTDGLFERFPRPDHALALHVSAELPAGTIGYTSGYAFANVDSVDIRVRGVGGHGAYPQMTKDPVVLASQIVLALQTITSRELSPLESAVVTVGAFNAGHKHNVISDEAHLQLTVRSYSERTRQQIFAAIRRIAEGQARAAGVPEDRMPEVALKDEFTPAVYNDPDLARRLGVVFAHELGHDKVRQVPPVMAGEDFGMYGRVAPKIPSSIFWLGAVHPEQMERSLATGEALPSLHSAVFAPAAGIAIRTGVGAMTAAALYLMPPRPSTPDTPAGDY